MPAVSVIVPVYNTEKYLEECIRSLTEQTLSSLELIFVDDGSTDASPKILERYRARDPEHIRVITQKNAGQGKARNVGLAAATGEYVGFVDSDDYVDRRMYAAMYTRAGSEELDLVECDFHYLEEDGREKRSYGSVVIGCMNPKAGCAGSVMNLLQIDGFNHQVKITQGVLEEECSEMLSTFFKELREKKKQAKMLGVYVYHRDRGDSTMNDNKSRRVGNIFPVLQDACRFYREKELMDTYGKELEYFCTRILLCSSMGRISRVRDRKLRKSLREETFVFLRENFPEYRKNPYLGNGLKGRYLRIATPALCGICGGTIGRCRPGGLPG